MIAQAQLWRIKAFKGQLSKLFHRFLRKLGWLNQYEGLVLRESVEVPVNMRAEHISTCPDK